MFVSQLYPHHEQFKIHDWSMIVFSRETTGAIKKREGEPPAQGNVPPSGDDPVHPHQHGYDFPPEDIPIDDHDMDDDNSPEYQTGPDQNDEDDDQEYIIPDDHGPPPDDDLDMPGIQDSGETQSK